jgi:hypothetical protein
MTLGEKGHAWFWTLKPNKAFGANGFDAGSNAAVAVIKKAATVKQKGGERSVLQCAAVIVGTFLTPTQQQAQEAPKQKKTGNGRKSAESGATARVGPGGGEEVASRELVAATALIVTGGTDGSLYVFAPNSDPPNAGAALD